MLTDAEICGLASWIADCLIDRNDKVLWPIIFNILQKRIESWVALNKAYLENG
jgi:hypothetical protein